MQALFGAAGNDKYVFWLFVTSIPSSCDHDVSIIVITSVLEIYSQMNTPFRFLKWVNF